MVENDRLHDIKAAKLDILQNRMNGIHDICNVNISVDYKQGKCSFKVDDDVLKTIRTIFVGLAAMRDEITSKLGEDIADIFDDSVSDLYEYYKDCRGKTV